MCGRMTMTRPDLDALADLLDAEVAADCRAATAPRWNVAPSHAHPLVLPGGVVGARARIVSATWGFPTRHRPHLPNVRAETAAERFAAAFEHRHAIVPADGFYEWSGAASARRASWITPTAGGVLLFAALWQGTPGPVGDLRFSILTVDANADVAPIHHRMPVILAPDDARRWLARDPALSLVPAPDGTLATRRVGARVNSVAHDDAACLAPDDGRGQLSLL